MNLKIFSKNIRFSKATAFSKKLESPGGSMFLASTKWNEPKITVSVEKLATAGIREHVLRIPFQKMPHPVQRVAVIGGPRPTTTVFPGPRPKKVIRQGRLVAHSITIGSSRTKPLLVELDASMGKWHFEPDVAAGVLNVSFAARKTKR